MSISICNTATDSRGRELIDHGTALFPIACYHDDLSVDSVPWHWHDELEAVIVTHGTAFVTAGAQTYTVEQGCGFFINAGIIHAAWGKEGSGCRFHSVVFHPRLVGSSIDSIFWQSYIQPLVKNKSLESILLRDCDSVHRDMISCIEGTWQSCANEEFGYEFNVRTELSKLILLLSACHPSPIKPISEKVLRDSERIKIMLSFIHEFYFERLDAALIAKQAMISESECLRCFKSAIGSSPMRYLKQYRIQRAAEQLISGHGKIIDIGAQCGFFDTSYFIKSFREFKGCTPTMYRKNKTAKT